VLGRACDAKSDRDFAPPAARTSGQREKKVWWHTLFGIITVLEPVLRGSGHQVRPFLRSAEVSARSCSLPLQRAITDFGADHGFGHVPKKLQEHDGITIAVSTVRKITEGHGEHMREQQDRVSLPVSIPGCRQQVGEIDGSMVPIVTIGEEVGDKRKQKTLQWQEARLVLVHAQGSVTPKFAATFGGSVEESGHALLSCAVAAGFGTNTQVHGVGDGAVWIAEQFDVTFGVQASYLVDFYHVCDYLAAASTTCAPDTPHAWMETQKQRLKNNEGREVLNQLRDYVEAEEVATDHAPVRACVRYLSNRPHHLDYKGALEKGLPIGSGAIESAHRYVIQQRLKLPGAWWKADNVEPMLALRIVRANEDWDKYWGQLAAAA
jgi:Uncharacterised protein family (UPF0236)